jgi:hypothetical protein
MKAEQFEYVEDLPFSDGDSGVYISVQKPHKNRRKPYAATVQVSAHDEFPADMTEDDFDLLIGALQNAKEVLAFVNRQVEAQNAPRPTS